MDASKPFEGIFVVSINLRNSVESLRLIDINNKYYLQIQGTAMGTKMAPAYANLFMGKLEEKTERIRQTT